MQNIMNTAILGLFFGTIGTTIGGIIGCSLKRHSNKFLSFILSFAAGLMMAVICFDLIPESLGISSIVEVIIGIIFGIIIMILCDLIVDKKFNNKEISNKNLNKTTYNLLKTGIIVSIGLAIHNIPEGLAIGSGFDASTKLGFSLALAICFHDIPEGISMAMPMKNGGMKAYKIMFYVILSGIATGVGALIGSIIGKISEQIIAIALSFAAGAMLYIVSGELIPESNNLYKGRISALGNMLGLIIGICVTLL